MASILLSKPSYHDLACYVGMIKDNPSMKLALWEIEELFNVLIKLDETEGDTETSHEIADDLLIIALRKAASFDKAMPEFAENIISKYNDIHKWYA